VARAFSGQNHGHASICGLPSSVVPGTVEAELSLVRARGKHSLVNEPTTPAEAWGCCAEYLSGTSSWEQWNIQERIRETHAFKALKVSGFRTKAAREMRDAGYAKRALLFCIRQ
jgi:hypothetical protein